MSINVRILKFNKNIDLPKISMPNMNSWPSQQQMQQQQPQQLQQPSQMQMLQSWSQMPTQNMFQSGMSSMPSMSSNMYLNDMGMMGFGMDSGQMSMDYDSAGGGWGESL